MLTAETSKVTPSTLDCYARVTQCLTCRPMTHRWRSVTRQQQCSTMGNLPVRRSADGGEDGRRGAAGGSRRPFGIILWLAMRPGTLLVALVRGTSQADVAQW